MGALKSRKPVLDGSKPLQRYTPDWLGKAMFESGHGPYVKAQHHEAVVEHLQLRIGGLLADNKKMAVALAGSARPDPFKD